MENYQNTQQKVEALGSQLKLLQGIQQNGESNKIL